MLARLNDIALSAGQRVLVRVDMNVPLTGGAAGEVADDSRIRAHLPTIRYILSHGARVVLVSHLGRPEEGRPDARFSLAPVAARLGELLGQAVAFSDCVAEGLTPDAPVTMCENIRFYAGESANDPALAQRLAALCDVFVMDAFGCAHRAHASVCAVADAARVACAGPLLLAEIDALDRVMRNPQRPLLAIVGGAKTETKMGVLNALNRLADDLILGGAIANTALVAAGQPVGRSLYDRDHIDAARQLLDGARDGALNGAKVLLPTDVVCAPELAADAETRECAVDEVGASDMILDFGAETRTRVEEAVGRAATILWNGPLGAFEHAPFARGTEALARAVARSKAYTVAGGGDTLAAIERFGVADEIAAGGHISTGGGAFLEWIERRGELPALRALLKRRAA